MAAPNTDFRHAIFGDSVGWIALANPHDHLHLKAASLERQIQREGRVIVTTGFIIAESIAGLNGHLRHSAIVRFVDGLRASPRIHILHVTEVMEENGYMLYKSRPDKVWSLTDCISFLVMAEMGLMEAFTHDHHFEQAGFRAMLR